MPTTPLPVFPHIPGFAQFGGKASLGPHEAADAIGVQSNLIRELVESGQLAAVNVASAPGHTRKALRILRCSLEAWWLERYLAEHGEEFPWPNPTEVAIWRQKLRLQLNPVRAS